ncbi:MAG: LTA synthase family protein [Desulfovermiculus sp.]
MMSICSALPPANLKYFFPKASKKKIEMNILNYIPNYQKCYGAALLLGFLIKYNYLMFFIYQVPSVTGLIFKNVFLVILIYFYVLPFVKNKNGRMYILLFLIFFTLFFLSNVWYNRYFGNYLSLSDMLMGQGIRPFKVLIRQLVRSYDIYFILDVILIIYVNYKDKTSRSIRSILSGKYALKNITPVVLLVCLLVAQMVSTNYVLGNDRPFSLYKKSTSSFVNVYGIIPLYIFEVISFYYPPEQDKPPEPPASAQEELTDKEAAKYVADIENIIIIQVESLDKTIIDYRHKGVEVTPFLNKLKEKALFFESFYAQHVNGSFDAEFSSLTSIYPLNKNYGFKVNDLTQFASLVNILNEKKYSTLAFHGNDKKFFHRHKAFPELGFETFYSREDFSFDDTVMHGRHNTFGINDYDFFLQSLDYLKEADTPFFSFFITVTSHTPFDFYPADHAQDKFQDVQDPLVRDYLRSISFVDKSIEMFFSKLKEMNFFEDTLIVIYSDHESGVEGNGYTSHRDFKLQKPVKAPESIPLFIIHPDITPEVITKEGTTTDLAPTILGLLGEDEKPEEFLGHSLLKKEQNPVYFMHEIPQVLHHGQLFALLPTGIEQIGYTKEAGKKDIEPPKEENLTDIVEYTQEILVERRAEPD